MKFVSFFLVLGICTGSVLSLIIFFFFLISLLYGGTGGKGEIWGCIYCISSCLCVIRNFFILSYVYLFFTALPNLKTTRTTTTKTSSILYLFSYLLKIMFSLGYHFQSICFEALLCT